MTGSIFALKTISTFTEAAHLNHKPIDGVQFFSYSIGILRYAQISEDGQIMTGRNYNRVTYYASVIGHGTLKGPSGKDKNFQTEEAATREAIKVWRKMQEKKA